MNINAGPLFYKLQSLSLLICNCVRREKNCEVQYTQVCLKCPETNRHGVSLPMQTKPKSNIFIPTPPPP